MPWHYIPLTNLLIVNLKVNCFIFLLYCFSWVVFLRRFIRVGKIKVHNPGICWQESEGTRKKDKPKHGWEKIYWPLHCKIVLTNLLKSESDFLRRDDQRKVIFCKRNTGWKWLSLKIWQGKSYFLWKDEHTKVIIFENMTPKKPIHLKRWPCKRYYLLKRWDSQSNNFLDDRVKVIIEGKGLKRCGPQRLLLSVVPPKNIASWFWFCIQ